MLFNSPAFLFAFLPIVAALCFVLQRTRQFRLIPFALLIGSLFFYGYWEPKYLLVIVLSILANYAIGLQIIATKQSSRPTRKLPTTGVVLNLVPLFYFKYASFAISLIPATDAFADTLAFSKRSQYLCYTSEETHYRIELEHQELHSRELAAALKPVIAQAQHP